MKFWKIPENLLDKYRGCGNGIVVVDKQTDQVLDWSYTDQRLRRINDQNLFMCEDAGRVIKDDDKTTTYRANFSCGDALLF